MARMPRLVVPGYPHHVTQQGYRRMKTFFTEGDYQAYLNWVKEFKTESGVEVWAYCLMPNHVLLVVVPQQEDSLSRFFRQVHRYYSRYINFRENWRGHLWQEQFHSFVMDEQYLLTTVRYVELNAVRAHLCQRPEQWRWSSTQAHRSRCDEGVVTVQRMLSRIEDWDKYLQTEDNMVSDIDCIRTNSRTGRPLGSRDFIESLEVLTGKDLQVRKPDSKSSIK